MELQQVPSYSGLTGTAVVHAKLGYKSTQIHTAASRASTKAIKVHARTAAAGIQEATSKLNHVETLRCQDVFTFTTIWPWTDIRHSIPNCRWLHHTGGQLLRTSS